jgi:hypothetical protein
MTATEKIARMVAVTAPSTTGCAGTATGPARPGYRMLAVCPNCGEAEEF